MQTIFCFPQFFFSSTVPCDFRARIKKKVQFQPDNREKVCGEKKRGTIQRYKDCVKNRKRYNLKILFYYELVTLSPIKFW